MGYNYISIKKWTTIFLWVWNFKEAGELPKNFQNNHLGESFWKNGLQHRFFSEKKLKGISYVIFTPLLKNEYILHGFRI